MARANGRTKLRLMLLLAFCCKAVPCRAAADLVIGFSYAKAPYISAPTPYDPAYLDINSKHLGLEIDLFRAAMAHTHQPIKLYYGSFARIIRLLSQGLLDGAETSGPAFADIYYSQALISCTNVAVSRQSEHLTIDRIDDLHKHSIAAWQDAATDLGPTFNAMAKANPRYSENPDQQSQYRMFTSRRVQVLVIDQYIFTWWNDKLGRKPPEAYQIHRIFPQNNEYRMGFNSKSVRDLFDQGLEAIKRSGDYDRIVQAYLK
ncbi:MAG: transporter substrate-binding domain-containing protein [Proteobacteria bacterium]|nr:transporter substrate-binding domain-containing protein [Pseudomonadota bacterium]